MNAKDADRCNEDREVDYAMSHGTDDDDNGDDDDDDDDDSDDDDDDDDEDDTGEGNDGGVEINRTSPCVSRCIKL
ncbi:hypothetical protein ElyMa_000160900 [Elysia marginata]|uniref:Uncharacterized protein n=1 Tax=Elysia marginata TaxID=1093978 RepID=A0AAV4ES79_9GAST|nr:hypothetical protein ElyMa_000160900 [Elysia marginata]